MIRFRDTVKISTLPNGLTIVTDELLHAQTTYAALNVHTGGWHDPRDKQGLAHLAEHLIGHGFSTMSGNEFDEENGKRVFLSSNLLTGPKITLYYAHGYTSDVEAYLSDMADSITALNYNQSNFDDEQGRIIDEMRNNAYNPELQKTILKQIALYGSKAAFSQVSGGTPQGFKNITLQDIIAYHQARHVGRNMTLLSSGDWAHGKACDWAEKNLAHLGMGEKSLALDTSYDPHDIWVEKDQPVTEIGVLFPFDMEWLQSKAGLTIFYTAIQKTIKTISDDLELYGISAGGNPLQDTMTGLTIFTTCLPNQVAAVISRTLNAIEESKDLFLQNFEEIKRRSLKWQDLNCYANMATPEQRFDMLLDSLIERDLYPFDLDDFIDSFNNVDPEIIFEAILHSLQQKPATFYYGAITDELPTGDMIQRRDFSKRFAPVQTTQFDLRPFG